MTEYKGVMVYCEESGGSLPSITKELLGAGRKLADQLEETLFAVLMGNGVSALAGDVISHGADKVFVVEDPSADGYKAESRLTSMKMLAERVSPGIILIGHTGQGRDLAPRLAFRLGTCADLNCIDLEIDPESGRLLHTKQVYGGNALAVLLTESDPQIVTVRPKTFAALDEDKSRHGEVEKIDVDTDPSSQGVTLIGQFEDESEGIKLEDADIVVAGGRGIGSGEGFKELEKLAALLKGAVGASRPPCDDGWVPSKLQVGITGKTVTPDLYIAVALSGAPQHVCGASAKHIVAINRDPDANIFREAQFGVVGDWKRVLPAFKEKLEELLAE